MDADYQRRVYRRAAGQLEDLTGQIDGWIESAAQSMPEGLAEVDEVLRYLRSALDAIRLAKGNADRMRAQAVTVAEQLGEPAPRPVPDPVEDLAARIADQRQRGLFRLVASGFLDAMLGEHSTTEQGI